MVTRFRILLLVAVQCLPIIALNISSRVPVIWGRLGPTCVILPLLDTELQSLIFLLGDGISEPQSGCRRVHCHWPKLSFLGLFSLLWISCSFCLGAWRIFFFLSFSKASIDFNRISWHLLFWIDILRYIVSPFNYEVESLLEENFLKVIRLGVRSFPWLWFSFSGLLLAICWGFYFAFHQYSS